MGGSSEGVEDEEQSWAAGFGNTLRAGDVGKCIAQGLLTEAPGAAQRRCAVAIGKVPMDEFLRAITLL